MQLFYDKDNSSLEFRDLACPSRQRCIAVGAILEENGHSKGTAVLTSDGGVHWTYADLKELPVSLFFLNDSLGWMATTNGIWQTEESGRTWKKLKGLKGIERLWFQNEAHGWAVGYPKAIYETTDGGKEWAKVAAAQMPPSQADETDYTAISFAGPQTGIIAGNSTAGQRQNIPAWMDPANEQRRYYKRSSTFLLRTLDAGKDWKVLHTGGDGYLTRLHLLGPNSALALFEFPGADYPSGLFKMDLTTFKAAPAFQDAARIARDFAQLPDGDVLIAAVELPGKSSQIPVPGKLRILRSRTMQTWLDIPVDYRAVATRPVLAAADAVNVWVATDTGMILKLSE